jgi:hypothetical protein
MRLQLALLIVALLAVTHGTGAQGTTTYFVGSQPQRIEFKPTAGFGETLLQFKTTQDGQTVFLCFVDLFVNAEEHQIDV